MRKGSELYNSHYENEHQIHHFAHMRLCGCGQPEDAYNFVREVLSCFDRRESRAGGSWVDAEKAVESLLLAKPEAAAHVIAHLLTNLDLMEHGGSVGGSWLTDVGERIVDLGPVTDELDNDL